MARSRKQPILAGREDELREMAASGMYPDEIAERMGVTAPTVMRHLRRMGQGYAVRPPRTRAEKWLDEHGLEIGDLVDVTNCAGRTFTGRLVEMRLPLGFVSMEGDGHFAFSTIDAVVRRSDASRPGRFASGLKHGRLDDTRHMTEISPPGRRGW